MKSGCWLLLLLAGCALESGALPSSAAEDGAGPSGGDAGNGGPPNVAPPEAGVDGSTADGAVDAIDADAGLSDAGGRDVAPPDAGPSDSAFCTPSAETCDGTDEDCDGEVDEDVSCPCPRYTFRGSTYLFCTGLADYAGARANCRSVGYDLVSIESAAEDDWLWATMDAMTLEEVWVGLTDAVSEGTFVWPDGTVQRTPSGDVAYGGWHSAAPDNLGNEDCVELDRGRAGDWEDVGCDQLQTAICEAP